MKKTDEKERRQEWHRERSGWENSKGLCDTTAVKKEFCRPTGSGPKGTVGLRR